tara:strand:- start:228 stop:350 length:123 start_codon:yes stop_codon:yes gene_type:complete
MNANVVNQATTTARVFFVMKEIDVATAAVALSELGNDSCT